MGDDPKLDAIIRLSGQIDRLEQKANELRDQLSVLVYGSRASGGDPDVDGIIQRADEISRSVQENEKIKRKVRRSRFPEGPPLNKKVMDFLRSANRPCGYKDILTEVDAHHQSIQNALRDLERRGLISKLGPNQWVAADSNGGLTLLK